MTGLHGFTTPLWPVRYKPLPDELLSCWLVRLAHGHGLKVQTFCNLLFGNQHQVWNRDIDRLAPAWLLDALVLHTGTPRQATYGTTLRMFDGVLYAHNRATGHLPWIQSLQVYHRKRTGFGQQYCPACLAADSTPYFRKTWRLALMTFCIEHNCQLLDRCWACQAPVSFHRMDMGHAGLFEDAPLSGCFACGADLALGPRMEPRIYDQDAFNLTHDICNRVGQYSVGLDVDPQPDVLAVLRHLAALMLSRKRKVHLREYMADRMGVQDPITAITGRPPIESQSSDLRHALIQWAAWLLFDPANRLSGVCSDGAILSNHLVHDFEAPPDWYVRALPTTHR